MKHFEKIIGKGRRGIVYEGEFEGKKCAVKTKNKKSEAINRIDNEIQWLKKLNSHGIGPKFYSRDENSFSMELLEGESLDDFLKNCKSKDLIKEVLLDIFDQCRIMDKLKVNKFEMHNITKNAIVVGNKPTLIDFERCKTVLEPKNLTQFSQFLMKKGFCNDLENLKNVLKEYKKDMSDKNYKLLRSLFF